jgi:hypothetical protein
LSPEPIAKEEVGRSDDKKRLITRIVAFLMSRS